MMSSCSAAHPGIPVWWSHFVPVLVRHWGKWFLQGFFAKEDWSIINYQQYFILTFSSPFWNKQRLYFVSPAECVWEIVSMIVSCTSVVSLVSVPPPHLFFLLLQFASVILQLICQMHLIGGWSAFFFFFLTLKTLCAVSPYRLEITVHSGSPLEEAAEDAAQLPLPLLEDLVCEVSDVKLWTRALLMLLMVWTLSCNTVGEKKVVFLLNS